MTKRIKKVILNFFGAVIVGVGFNFGLMFLYKYLISNLPDWIHVLSYVVLSILCGGILGYVMEYILEGYDNLHPDKEDFIALWIGFTGINILLGFVYNFYL